MTKIMIVDDEQDLREMIALMLHKEGFQTNTAENDTDLLNKIDVFQPDIITLDVMMPGLTTREILDKLKEKKPLYGMNHLKGDEEKNVKNNDCR